MCFLAREGDIEPAFTAALIDRAEVHQHLPVGSGAVTDAEDDDVAFVALDVFQVLDEQTGELAVLLAFELGVEPGAKMQTFKHLW